jgi:hypothetical protein
VGTAGQNRPSFVAIAGAPKLRCGRSCTELAVSPIPMHVILVRFHRTQGRSLLNQILYIPVT